MTQAIEQKITVCDRDLNLWLEEEISSKAKLLSKTVGITSMKLDCIIVIACCK